MSHLTSKQVMQLLDGMIEAGEQVRLNAHLTLCGRCRQEFALQQALYRATKQQSLVKTSAGFTARVLAQTALREKEQSAVLKVLTRYGHLLAIVFGLGILSFALSTISGWSLTTKKLDALRPSDTLLDYSARVTAWLGQQFHQMAQKLTEFAGEQNLKLFFIAIFIILALTLFDRLVVQQFIKTRS